MRRLALAVSSLFALTLIALEARQAAPPQTTFRTGVDLVDVDVSILDKNRLPVQGLTLADFTVLEDGKARPVVAFSRVDLPARELPTARWMSAVAPDRTTNQVPREGRLIVFLIDRTLLPEHGPPVRAFVESAIDQLRPGDLAAVVYSTKGVPQGFTADRQRLIAAMRQPFVGLPDGDDGGAVECLCGVCSLDTIANIAESVQDVRQRRKIIVVIGTNISIQSASLCGGALALARNRAVRALDNGNVTVHAFDPTGLETLAPGASVQANDPNRPASQNALRRRGNISVLPGQTSGRVVSNTLRPGDAVSEIFRESSAYYVLGFYPAAKPDGRFHEVKVKVSRPDVIIQARRGFYAGGGPRRDALPGVNGTSPALRAAVAGLWPDSDLPLGVSVAPFAAMDLRSATLAVLLDLREPRDLESALSLTGPSALDVFVGAFDRNGRALGYQRQTVTATDDMRSTGVDIVGTLPLKPGRYEIRAAVEDRQTRRTGSVYTYVDVPNFVTTAVSLSGLLLHADPAEPVLPRGALGPLVPMVPTMRREFRRTDHVTGFVRIYQGLSRAAVAGYVTTEIVDQKEQPVFHQEARVLPAQFGASRALDYTVDVPVDRLLPGSYLLSVEAKHGNEAAHRELRFVMLP